MAGIYQNKFPLNSKEIMTWLQDREKTPLVMGIVNVTPDSFYAKSRIGPMEEKLEQRIVALINQGAQILDVGGESSRPGSHYVSESEELERVIPIIKKIREISSIPISIDTRKASVAEKSFKEGANIINDISAAEDDPDMIPFLAESKLPVVIMHKKGNPDSMQKEPQYTNVTEEVLQYLRGRIELFNEKGIDSSQCIIDPGIGFGKSFEHNRILFTQIDKFTGSGFPVLMGFSRKGILGSLLSTDNRGKRLSYGELKGAQDYLVHSGERDTGNSKSGEVIPRGIDGRLSSALALTAYCVSKEVAIVRSHDVKETADVIQSLALLCGN